MSFQFSPETIFFQFEQEIEKREIELVSTQQKIQRNDNLIAGLESQLVVFNPTVCRQTDICWRTNRVRIQALEAEIRRLEAQNLVSSDSVNVIQTEIGRLQKSAVPIQFEIDVRTQQRVEQPPPVTNIQEKINQLIQLQQSFLEQFTQIQSQQQVTPVQPTLTINIQEKINELSELQQPQQQQVTEVQPQQQVTGVQPQKQDTNILKIAAITIGGAILFG